MKRKTIIIIVAIVVALAGLGFGGYKYREYKDTQQYMEWKQYHAATSQAVQDYIDKAYEVNNSYTNDVILFISNNAPVIDVIERYRVDPNRLDARVEECITLYKTYQDISLQEGMLYMNANSRVKKRIDKYIEATS